jgi:hypothetical protein
MRKERPNTDTNNTNTKNKKVYNPASFDDRYHHAAADCLNPKKCPTTVRYQLYAAVTVAACQDPSLTGVSPLRRGDINIESLPPGSTTFKGSMNVCCIK